MRFFGSSDIFLSVQMLFRSLAITLAIVSLTPTSLEDCAIIGIMDQSYSIMIMEFVFV